MQPQSVKSIICHKKKCAGASLRRQLNIIKILYIVKHIYILRKTIEGYLDSVPSLTFNTIKTKLIMHAFH